MRFDARTFQDLLDAIKASGKSAHVLSHKEMEALEVADSVYGGTLYPANDKKDRVLRHHSYMMVAKNTIDPCSNKRYLTLIGVTKAGYPEIYTAYLEDLFPEGNGFFLRVENRPSQ